MMLRDYMCQEKEEEEDFPVFKIALTDRYKDTKTTHKSTEKDRLQPPGTILTTRGPSEQK